MGFQGLDRLADLGQLKTRTLNHPRSITDHLPSRQDSRLKPLSYRICAHLQLSSRLTKSEPRTLLSKTPFNFHVEGKVYLDRDRGEVWPLPAADFRHLKVPIAPIAVQLAPAAGVPACRRR
jgi:hypothetical protein